MRIRIDDSLIDAIKRWASRVGPTSVNREAALEILRGIASAREDAESTDYPDIVEKARDLHGSDEVEIDEDAVLSRGDDGVWVAGWLFVANADLPGYEEEQEDDAA